MSELRAIDDPARLLEAARVFNAAGPDYRPLAESISELALNSTAQTDLSVRAAIVCDAAALRLCGRIPGGYRAALEMLNKLKEQLDKARAQPGQKATPASEDNGARLFILRSFALGQFYRALMRGDLTVPELAAGSEAQRSALREIAQDIQQDLAEAFSKDPYLYQRNLHFWDERYRARISPDALDPEDDLVEAYKGDAILHGWLDSVAPPADPHSTRYPPAK